MHQCMAVKVYAAGGDGSLAAGPLSGAAAGAGGDSGRGAAGDEAAGALAGVAAGLCAAGGAEGPAGVSCTDAGCAPAGLVEAVGLASLA